MEFGISRKAGFAFSSLILAIVLTACGEQAAPEVATQPTSPPESIIKKFPGEGVRVQPARGTWDTGYFQEALYSKALEELGYEVLDHQELDNPDFYEAVASGEVDFWANGWFPLHNDYRDLFEQGASIAGTVAAFGALQGYMVDKAGAEEFGITSLADFKRDEVKQAFDADGNGKADLIACPENWSCKNVIGFQLDTAGLRDHIDERIGPYSESMRNVIARFHDGQHVLFYTWTPNWTVNQLKPGQDVLWIEAATAAHPDGFSEAELAISGVEGCVKDPCLMGFRGADIKVVANNEFLENNPSAATIFQVIAIPLSDIFKQNNRMNAGENTQEDIDSHAEEWIALNRDLFDSWLSQARQAQ